MSRDFIRVLDTGTRRPDRIPECLDVRHQPALRRSPVEVDTTLVSELLSRRRHLVFYSRYAVQVVVDKKLIATADDHRLWAVGQKTATALEKNFAGPIQIPDDECFTGLRQALSQCDEALPIAAFGLLGTTRDLSSIAAQWGVDFTCIPVYQSVPVDAESLVRAFTAHRPHWITVTSSRGAHSIADALDAGTLRRLHTAGDLRFAAIGPSTAETMRELELDAAVVLQTPTRAGLLQSIADEG